jgi:hypothetical protein
VGTPQSAHVVGAIATPSSVGRWIRFDSRARVRSIDRAIDPPRESRARGRRRERSRPGAVRARRAAACGVSKRSRGEDRRFDFTDSRASVSNASARLGARRLDARHARAARNPAQGTKNNQQFLRAESAAERGVVATRVERNRDARCGIANER